MESIILDWAGNNGLTGIVIVSLGYFMWQSAKEHSAEREIWRLENKERYEKIVDVIKSQQDAFLQVSERLTEHSMLIKDLKDTLQHLNDKR